MPNIVILGAGVSGLTVALLLSKKKENVVTVVGKHHPGDYDIEYTSPWAGANYMPMADEAGSRWERETWPELERLATEVPEAGIHFQNARSLTVPDNDAPRFSAMFDTNPWFRNVVPDFRVLGASELPPGITQGTEYKSVCINTALYLPYLVGQCVKQGVVLKRAVLSHVTEAANLHHSGTKADVVVNCSGLLACKLGGVEDAKVVPARGQIVLVRNELSPMVTLSGGTGEEGELAYSMMRACGGGTIIGGTYHIGDWRAEPDKGIGLRIMERAVAFHPDLKGKTVEDLDVIRHGVGLRPYREGGVRLEREKIGEVEIVHNYGHAGWGYQGSYGCAERVLELIDEVLAEGK